MTTFPAISLASGTCPHCGGDMKLENAPGGESYSAYDCYVCIQCGREITPEQMLEILKENDRAMTRERQVTADSIRHDWNRKAYELGIERGECWCGAVRFFATGTCSAARQRAVLLNGKYGKTGSGHEIVLRCAQKEEKMVKTEEKQSGLPPVPDKPAKKGQLLKGFYEKHLELIARYIEVYGNRKALEMWGCSSSKWGKLRKKLAEQGLLKVKKSAVINKDDRDYSRVMTRDEHAALHAGGRGIPPKPDTEGMGSLEKGRAMHDYYEANKGAILADFHGLLEEHGEKEGTRKFLELWGIPRSTWEDRLRKRWLPEVYPPAARKPGSRGKNEAREDNGLPKYPKFDSNWSNTVQVAWLDNYARIATNGGGKIASAQASRDLSISSVGTGEGHIA